MQAEHWDGTHRGFALPSGANSGPLSSLSTLLPGTWSPLSWGAFLDRQILLRYVQKTSQCLSATDDAAANTY